MDVKAWKRSLKGLSISGAADLYAAVRRASFLAATGWTDRAVEVLSDLEQALEERLKAARIDPDRVMHLAFKDGVGYDRSKFKE